MEEKIWIQSDGRQQGPYTLAELATMSLSPTTPVWYQGLPEWTIAINAPLTASLFAGQAPAAPQPQVRYAPGQQEAMPPCPPTYIVWAILVTICCCIIGGVISIIYSAQVTSRYNAGDYAGAVKASERAQIWLIESIVLGLICLPFALMNSVFTTSLFL